MLAAEAPNIMATTAALASTTAANVIMATTAALASTTAANIIVATTAALAEARTVVMTTFAHAISLTRNAWAPTRTKTTARTTTHTTSTIIANLDRHQIYLRCFQMIIIRGKRIGRNAIIDYKSAFMEASWTTCTAARAV